MNLTWEDALLKHEDTMEIDRNTKELLDKIPRCGAQMEPRQLEVIKTLASVSFLSNHQASEEAASKSITWAPQMTARA